MKPQHLLISGLLLFTLNCAQVFALEVDRIYGSNMVLQQGMPLPIRGKAAAGTEVKISFAGQTAAGKTNDEGRWEIELEPLTVSTENRSLEISAGEKTTTLENILVGEVWLGSGQSNMAGKVAGYAKKDPTLAKIAARKFPQIRLRDNKGWNPATPDTIKGHSAILFAFGEYLHRTLEVPVGLYVGAVGGTPSGAWLPKEIFDSSESIQAEIAEFAKNYDKEAAIRLHEKKVAAWETAAAKAKAEGKKVRGRKPNSPVDPGESTRGRKTGGLFDQYIRYSVGFPIRGALWDQGEAGSGILGLDQYTSMSELIRGWRELWGQGDFPFVFVQKPSGKGNAFDIENQITREADAFSALPDIAKVDRGGSGRFLYTRLMRNNNNAWMVPACDLGATIHPINKWGYGNRAGQVAAQKVYQTSGVQAYGPIYQSHSINGSEVSITFSETGSGLTTKHSDQLQGFAVSDDAGKWHWATAKISGLDSVALSCAEVANPQNIRFAWANDRTWANLFNKEGMPALALTTEK